MKLGFFLCFLFVCFFCLFLWIGDGLSRAKNEYSSQHYFFEPGLIKWHIFGILIVVSLDIQIGLIWLQNVGT